MDKKSIISLPTFVSYVDGKEFERQSGVTQERLIEMIEKSLK